MKSSAARRSEPSLTAFDATLGSFAYMAPEQVRGSARVDERADLYALGAVAFRALTGRLPFEGSNALTLIALKLDRDPPTLAQTTGDTWPAAIEKFLSKIMAREREKRFGGAMDALEALAQGLPRDGQRAPPSAWRRLRQFPIRDDRTEVTAGSFTDVGPGLVRRPASGGGAEAELVAAGAAVGAEVGASRAVVDAART